MKVILTTFGLILSSALLISSNSQANQKPFTIAIHGGAGTISKANLSPE